MRRAVHDALARQNRFVLLVSEPKVCAGRAARSYTGGGGCEVRKLSRDRQAARRSYSWITPPTRSQRTISPLPTRAQLAGAGGRSAGSPWPAGRSSRASPPAAVAVPVPGAARRRPTDAGRAPGANAAASAAAPEGRRTQSGQAPAQPEEDETVARSPGGAFDLTSKQADLVPQRQQLDVPAPTVSAADEGEVGEQAGRGVDDRQEQRAPPREQIRHASRFVAPSLTIFLHPTGFAAGQRPTHRGERVDGNAAPRQRPRTMSMPARIRRSCRAESFPIRSDSSARSIATTWETFATESRGRPADRACSRTLPGASAQRRLLVSGTQATVAMRLRLNASP
jgi:hypothetical protein